jgi:hypothetical protein
VGGIEKSPKKQDNYEIITGGVITSIKDYCNLKTIVKLYLKQMRLL